MNILHKIIKDKKKEVIQDKKINFYISKSIHLKRKFFFEKRLINFKKKNKIAIIAEIKKASPSKGMLRKNFNPIKIAKEYYHNGVACISVLTEKKYFLGNKKFISDIKQRFQIPLLCKDFFIDPYQVYEAHKLGADCILVLIKQTNKTLVRELYRASEQLGLNCIMEVHSKSEMETALNFKKSIIGINNRNLENFKVDLNNTVKIYNSFKKELKNRTVICESGIHTKADIAKIKKETDINNFLVGESLMKSSSIKNSISSLIE